MVVDVVCGCGCGVWLRMRWVVVDVMCGCGCGVWLWMWCVFRVGVQGLQEIQLKTSILFHPMQTASSWHTVLGVVLMCEWCCVGVGVEAGMGARGTRGGDFQSETTSENTSLKQVVTGCLG